MKTAAKKQKTTPKQIETGPAKADGFARINLKLPKSCGPQSGGMAVIYVVKADGSNAYFMKESLAMDAWTKSFTHDIVDGVYRTVLLPVKAGQKIRTDLFGDVGAPVHVIES